MIIIRKNVRGNKFKILNCSFLEGVCLLIYVFVFVSMFVILSCLGCEFVDMFILIVER